MAESVVFIVSTGRTGTLSIARALDRHFDEITARHEPYGSRAMRLIGNAYACDRISESIVRRMARVINRVRVERTRTTVYVEVSPHLRSIIGPLSHEFPAARFAHIVRHPKNYIQSYVGHGVFDGFKGWIGRSVPYWLIKPEYFEPPTALRWCDMSVSEALAWRWTTLNTMIESHSERLGYRYKRFRFEDLFGGGDGLAPLADWILGRRVSRATLGHTPRANVRSPTAASRALETGGLDESAIRKYCGKLAEHYGYRDLR